MKLERPVSERFYALYCGNKLDLMVRAAVVQESFLWERLEQDKITRKPQQVVG